MDIIKKINKAKTIWQVLPELSEQDLEKAITIAAESYYNSDVSLISDEIFDVLVEKLKQLNPKSKVFKQTGAPVKGKKVKLPYWMGSMDKVKSDEKLIDNWIKTYKGPYLVSDKLDGISCLLTMNDGDITLYTRGDGTFGQNITHLLNLVNMSVDDLYDLPDKEIVIRGELIMTKDNFEKYADVMSNARNMVAGIVNSKKESVNKDYAADVDFVSYEVIVPNMKPLEQMKLLKKWGLNVVYYDIYNDISLSILDGILQKRKKKSVYEIDGIIVTDDNKHTRNLSGNPPYSFAYKGMTQTANVKVIEVLWRPSKDGFLVPRIHFEKVRLSQADLEYTTGFNAKFIVDNKIGPGAIITVVRSGDVIPYVMGVVKPAKKPALPEDYDFEWDDNNVNIILTNAADDETVIIQRLTKFVRDIGVENLSEGIVARLVRAGYDTIPKIMSLTIDDFLDLEGFKETLATKLYNNLRDALENMDLLTLMAASNIFGRGFGERKLKKILDNYPDIINKYSKKTHTYWRNKLLDLEGFDTITVDSFLSALPTFQEFYDVVSEIVEVQPYINKVKKSGSFKGETVVFTGFRNKDWQKFIEAEGGKVSGSVSKNTTLLVYNDGEESSSKYLTAKKLGIKTISKSDFAKKYNI
ncbi:NAD-dependent DNA ligase [Tupanvirus deep ocean]|uniref:NAD-dependent DNA ligase n=2 Tax=Tupanvirus TaxID=2094720 RepID=A0AC62A7M5_9VIRU|nr:NAD-dependent DNA ligase [Tupanvirus deep ocean]QKU33791.1 NAD-dependent DNA ligase [Tupanvirus deep ocean]